MERPIIKPIGTPTEELDTPSLIVDGDVLNENIETMASFFRDRPQKLRPLVSSHRSPTIAHKQIRAGGTVEGIAVTTLSQAEVFIASGFTDVYIANLVVTKAKIARLCALTKQATVTVAVDSHANVNDLNDDAARKDTTIRVIIYVSAGDGLFGVDSDQEAVDLASTITNASNLELAGITGGEAVNDILGAKRTIEAAGIPVYSVTINGEADYKQVGMMEDVTEVLAGSYALMDHSRRELFPEFKCAGRIMSTVTSRPEDGYMITDAGQKSIGADTGFPSIDNLPESSVKGLSAEHGSIYFSQSKHCNPQLGDKVWCTPHDIATCVNLHDYMFIVSDGALEAIWDVPARGRYR